MKTTVDNVIVEENIEQPPEPEYHTDVLPDDITDEEDVIVDVEDVVAPIEEEEESGAPDSIYDISAQDKIVLMLAKGVIIDKSMIETIRDATLIDVIKNRSIISESKLVEYTTPELFEYVKEDIAFELQTDRRTFEDKGASLTFTIPEELSELGTVGEDYTIHFSTSLDVHSQYVALFDYAKRKGLTKGEVPLVGGLLTLTTEIGIKMCDTILEHRYRAMFKYTKYMYTLHSCKTLKELLAVVWEDVRTQPESDK